MNEWPLSSRLLIFLLFPSGLAGFFGAAVIPMSNIISSLKHKARRCCLLGQNTEGAPSGAWIHRFAAMQFLTPKVFRVVCAVILAFVVVVVILRSPYGVTAYPEFHSPTLAGQGPTAPGSASDGLTSVDWSRFAYVQYVTNTEYLCNSVMLFEALHRLGSRADRLMMYPSSFSVDSDGGSTESALLQKARDAYGVKLAPIEVQHRSGNDG